MGKVVGAGVMRQRVGLWGRGHRRWDEVIEGRA